ncbi:MAG: metalloregulator ArsR/SmtB family transcription factor [Thioalkalispiraceae bacterium]|jgi:ArsR family transcriptional regulator
MSNHLNNDPVIGVANAFKALSNPNRLQIFLQLMRCCEPGTACDPDALSHCCVGDLGEDLNIAASTLSHHIKELSRAGLIQTERHGQHVQCRVNRDYVASLAGFFTLDQHLKPMELSTHE